MNRVAKQPAQAPVPTAEELSKLSPEEVGKLLGQLVSDEANEITGEYLKIEVGETRRVLFIGMTTMKKIDGEDGERTPAAKFITDSGEHVINADAVVVSTCQSLQPYTPLELIATGLAGTKNKEYKKFKIIKLS